MSDDFPKVPVLPLSEPHNRIIDFGAVRVQRGMTKRERSGCPHLNMTYDFQERRVWCDDCSSQIDPFDAFVVLAGHADEWAAKARKKLNEAAAASQQTLHLRAARAMEKAWNQRKAVPVCPHCNEALFPEDVVGGMSMISREMGLAKRKRMIAKRSAKQKADRSDD